jgi:hypothetical protein
MNALRQASEEKRPALHMNLRRKMWALGRLKPEEIEQLREATPEERGKRIDEVLAKLDALVASDMKAIQEAPDQERPALHKALHRKLWALGRLSPEELEALVQSPSEERRERIEELLKQLRERTHRRGEKDRSHGERRPDQHRPGASDDPEENVGPDGARRMPLHRPSSGYRHPPPPQPDEPPPPLPDEVNGPVD